MSLEPISGSSKIVVHNSNSRLGSAKPNKDHQGASVSQLATAARVAQEEPVTVNTGSITPDNMLKRIITSIPGSSSTTLTTESATDIISTLSLVEQNNSFEFTIINVHQSHVVVLGAGTGVMIVGNAEVASQSSAQFRVRRDSAIGASDSVKIYRLA
mgnify:CR=1 FL=1|jgi:hypothetical protein|tara:strand:+ start:986 stop:1456 length:471 start_codon:yes stop_codon:yes gene_type:complete